MSNFNPVLYKKAVLEIFDTFDLTRCEAVEVLSKVAQEIESLAGESDSPVPTTPETDAGMSSSEGGFPDEDIEEGEEGPMDKDAIADEIVSILKREFGESIEDALDLLEDIGDLILVKGEEESTIYDEPTRTMTVDPGVTPVSMTPAPLEGPSGEELEPTQRAIQKPEESF